MSGSSPTGPTLSPRATTALVVVRRVAILVTFLMVLVQPGFGTRATPTRATDIEVLVVVDRTRSMAAVDYQDGPRFHGVQQDLTALSEALPGARFALMSFGREVQVSLPFTSDTAAFATAIETMRLEGAYDGTGSRADRPLEDMAEVLERADEQHPDRRRMVVFVGDGENTADGEQESFEALDGLADGGVVLGYGTEEGARIPIADDLSDDRGYIYDSEAGSDAISSLDRENLETVAEQLGVPFLQRTEPGGMDAVADDFEATYAIDEDSDQQAKNDLTWLFGLILLALVLLELRSAWRAVWTSRHALTPTRKGVR